MDRGNNAAADRYIQSLKEAPKLSWKPKRITLQDRLDLTEAGKE